MVNADAGDLLTEIGQILRDDMQYPLNKTLLYAQVGDNWSSPAIFKNLGDHILYRDADMETICQPLMWLWEEADPAKRWAEMEYLIRDGHFTVSYTYPDEIDPDEDSFVRRDRIVAKYFGEKPIIYPPWEETGAQTFTL